MIDIETYRFRIGSFSQSNRPRKYLVNQEYFNNRRILKGVGVKIKIILGLFLLLGSLTTDLARVRTSCPAKIGGDGVWNMQRSEHNYMVRKGKKGTINFLFRYIHGNISQKGIKNLHLNIRSLRFKVLEVKNIIKEHSPHIFDLSECELRKVSINESDLKIPGYDVLFPKSWTVHGYARVIIYIKKSFNYEQIHDLQDNFVQSIWLRGNFKKGKKIFFCHAYRDHLSTQPVHEQRSYLGTFLHQWEAATEYGCPTEPNEVHISLDMNIDTYRGRWLQSDYRLLSLSRLVQEACNREKFTQLVTEPTRSMFNSVTNITDISCIDHIYCNAKFKCSKPVVTAFGGSDHDIVGYTRYTKVPPSPVRTVRKRSYKYFKKEDFLADLEQVDWSDVNTCEDVNLAVDLFTRIFRKILNIHAPCIIFQQRKKFLPWLTPETKELMRQKAKDLAIASSDAFSGEEQNAWNMFKFYRNKVNYKKNHDEIAYKRSKFEEVKDSPESVWKCAKTFMNWKSTGPPSQLVVDNILVTKAGTIAEQMNKFFISKIAKIRNGMRHVAWDETSCMNIMAGKGCKLGLAHVSEVKVKMILRNLSNSKSLAIDELDNFSVKLAADVIAKPLHHIITLSILQQKFPSQWKYAKVIPLHKKECTLNRKNYRPVAILSPLSRILEKLVYDQVYGYFTRNGILHQNMHGYRKSRSTQTALLQLYDRWVCAATQGQVSGAVLLDLSAAFDLVPPSILLSKLEIYGLEPDFLNWIKSYLTDRQQCVWIDHTASSFLHCEVGVPQGSNLGPLFFLLFVNDLSFSLDCDMEHLVSYWSNYCGNN